MFDRAAGYSYLRNVITEIVEERRDRDAGGSVQAVGEVVRRVRGEGETSGVRSYCRLVRVWRMSSLILIII